MIMYNIIVAAFLILVFAFISVQESIIIEESSRIKTLENHVEILAKAIKNQQYITDVLTRKILK